MPEACVALTGNGLVRYCSALNKSTSKAELVDNQRGASAHARRQEWLLLGVLALVQFVHILDFVLVMPLGPPLMRAFRIGAREFGWIVSAYTFAAAFSGLVAALFVDRFDRRSVLVTLLAGFSLGTALCAVAPTYWALVAARAVAGAFGGVLAAVVFAIVGDQIPEERRGTAMGIVMSGFSAASVLGLPFGLALASRTGWHTPFLLLAGLGAGVLALARGVLPSMRGHIVAAPSQAHLPKMLEVMRHPNHLRAFALTVAMMFAGFSVIPFISPYLVANVGVREADLTYVYLVGGVFTLFTSPIAGRLADRFGMMPVFASAALVSILPMMALTQLRPVSLTLALVVTTLFIIFNSARMVVVTTMITNSVEPRQRGSFMGVNSSVQQAGAGVASLAAGLVIHTAAGGRLERYGWVGALASVATLLAVVLAWRLGSAGTPASDERRDVSSAATKATDTVRNAPRSRSVDGPIPTAE